MNLFSPEQLNKIVAETLPAPVDMPAGHRSAVVATVDQHGIDVVVGFQLTGSGKWRLAGAYQHAWTGGDAVGAKLIGTF